MTPPRRGVVSCCWQLSTALCWTPRPFQSTTAATEVKIHPKSPPSNLESNESRGSECRFLLLLQMFLPPARRCVTKWWQFWLFFVKSWSLWTGSSTFDSFFIISVFFFLMNLSIFQQWLLHLKWCQCWINMSINLSLWMNMWVFKLVFSCAPAGISSCSSSTSSVSCPCWAAAHPRCTCPEVSLTSCGKIPTLLLDSSVCFSIWVFYY